MREGKADPAIAVLIVAFCCVVSTTVLLVDGAKGDEVATVLINGFTATHSADAAPPFEPVLYAPNRAFAFGFLRVGSASLDLAVVHLPSSFPLWRATPARTGSWSRPATLTFDTGLVLADPDGGVLWRTLNAVGDTVALLNSSNLVILRYARTLPAWQSFDHPSDTLVLGQNFTAASPPLISANCRFALRLGGAHLAMHMEFYGGRTTPMYWKHTAMMAEAEQGNNVTARAKTPVPVYGRLDDGGFFGLYLDGGGGGEERRVDVLSFDTFARKVTGLFRRLTLDDDGNLRAYYWTDGDESKQAWTPEYRAISGRCGLPTSCGAYGLCVPGGEAQCQCLTNGPSTSPPCHAEETADLCIGQEHADFDAVRRARVSVAYKERLPPFATNATVEECERACAGNCSCWGALHNGASGYCYLLDFPVETLLYEADDRKVGYFKVRKRPTGSTRKRGVSPGVRAATAVLSLVLAGVVAAGAYTGYRAWERKRRQREGMVQELAPGPYKDLKSTGSSNNSFKA